METLLGGAFVVRVRQVQLALEALELGLVETRVGFLDKSQTLVKRLRRLFEPAGLREGAAQEREVERVIKTAADGAQIMDALCRATGALRTGAPAGPSSRSLRAWPIA